MKLANRTLTSIAQMICGSSGGGTGYAWPNFPYRSSKYLTRFFQDCDIEVTHDGSTREDWVLERLVELNEHASSSPQMPSDDLLKVICELLNSSSFTQEKKDRSAALVDLNSVTTRDGLMAYFDEAGQCHLRNTATNASSEKVSRRQRWTPDEIARRIVLNSALDEVSEDELIENVLVPLFGRLGFIRMSVTGHKDKNLEYGNDLWMKYQLPTGHFLYFSAQVKKNKLDAAGKSKNTNVSEVLNQVRMLMDHPIWDPDINKRVLLDHVFIISAGEITKQARQWLGEHLDTESRRHIMFMDRAEILDLAIATQLHFGKKIETPASDSDDVPF